MTAVSGRGSRASSSQISSMCHRRRSSDSVLPVSVTTAAAAASSIKWPLTQSRPVIYPLKKVTSGSAHSFLPGFYYEENGSYLRFCPRPEIKMLAAAGGHVAAGCWLAQMSLYLVDPAPRHLSHRQHPALFTMPRMTVFCPHWISHSTRAPQPVQGSGGANDIFVLSAALKVRRRWAGHWTRQ